MPHDVTADMNAERKQASFNPEDLTVQFYGGEAYLAKRRALLEKLSQYEEFRLSDMYFWSQEEYITNAYKLVNLRLKFVQENHLENDPEALRIISQSVPMHLPDGLHAGMFMPTIDMQATDEQKAKWLPKCKSYEWIGTYAQTELGHGSYLRGLETTATYDKKTQEFVIHTPSVSGNKYWPGGLAKTTNMVVLMAQLVIDGKSLGPHPFLVQIRDHKTHRPMPGVTLRDIGPKAGFASIDNGMASFNNVRIPRENMLMRFSQVTPDGKYVQPPVDKIAYASMMMVRAWIVSGAADQLAHASTIAVRYSIARRQFHEGDNAAETKILDYQNQQYYLFPLIAQAHCFYYVKGYMNELFQDNQSRMLNHDFSLLAECHAVSSGLKAVTTWKAAAGMELARKTLGGQGYNKFSGLCQQTQDYLPACTYEGENNILLIQTGRYLLKMAEVGQKKPEFLSPSTKYLADLKSEIFAKCKAQTKGDMASLDNLEAAFRHVAARKAGYVAQAFYKAMVTGKSADEARNMFALDLIQAAQAHCNYLMVQAFVKGVNDYSGPAATKAVLNRLCILYCVTEIEQNLGDFMIDSYFTAAQAEQARELLKELLAAIRPDALALVDAFDLPDWVLRSALGRADGRAYEAIAAWAEDAPLNKYEILPGWEQYIRPVMGKVGTPALLTSTTGQASRL
eukprot:Clim_evm25s207 gene=Clim_evmTU25s207